MAFRRSGVQEVNDDRRMAVAEPETQAPDSQLKPASPAPERLNGKVPDHVKKPLGRRAQHRLAQAAAYGMLLIGTVLFILPFLWMVSGSFKDLESVFEYPPSLIPMETLSVVRDGRRYKLANYTPSRTAPSQKVVLLDQRPKEFLVTPLAGGTTQDRYWVPSEQLSLMRRVHFHVENYAQAWTAKPFTLFAFNTLWITFWCILGQVLSASLVAFGFARLQWPGRNLLFFAMLATMMLPSEVTMIPSYLIYRRLGWIDSFLPLTVPSFLGGSAFFIFLFRQFFMTLPRELDEAARVDGCSSFRIYWNVLMPLCKPIIATIAVFSFVGVWNDFQTPLIYLNSSEKFTLAVGLRFFQGTYDTYMHLLMAASTLVLLPVIVVFFFAQKQFVKSIVLTGIKG
jgi:multiple sugar transport system permease protein